jgi:hypothetical protein
MEKNVELPSAPHFAVETESREPSPERVLKMVRYVVASVNDDALQAWSDLWEQLRPGVTESGAVLPELQRGFTPAAGWPQFLEKFWLLKHYLDYVERFCKQTQ